MSHVTNPFSIPWRFWCERYDGDPSRFLTRSCTQSGVGSPRAPSPVCEHLKEHLGEHLSFDNSLTQIERINGYSQVLFLVF